MEITCQKRGDFNSEIQLKNKVGKRNEVLRGKGNDLPIIYSFIFSSLIQPIF
nr:MAG TPA: hypothetical protein [Caudoviricetes sp.]